MSAPIPNSVVAAVFESNVPVPVSTSVSVKLEDQNGTIATNSEKPAVTAASSGLLPIPKPEIVSARQGGLLPEPKSALLPDPKVALLPDPKIPPTTFAVPNNRVYVNVISADGTTVAEVPTLNDGFLLLSTVNIEFAGAAGLKYVNPRTGINRIIGPENGRLPPPPEGWGNTQYTVCVPVAVAKRAAAEQAAAAPPAKMAAVMHPANAMPHRPAAPQQQNHYQNFGNPIPQAPAQRGAAAARGVRPPARGAPPGVRGRGGAPGAPQGQRPAAPGGVKAPHAFCDVCQCALNSPEQAQAHFTGKKHMEAVTRGTGAPAAGRGGAAARGARGGRGGLLGRGGAIKGGALLNNANAVPVTGSVGDFSYGSNMGDVGFTQQQIAYESDFTADYDFADDEPIAGFSQHSKLGAGYSSGYSFQ